MLTIYKASAGSGKTFNLARRYLVLLLGTKNNSTGRYSLNNAPGKNTRTILAVTFTNKSTDEMKKRIVTELSILAYNPSDSKHLDYLLETMGLGNDVDRLSRAAEGELKHILFNFSSFNISTIDSFFQQVLRGFAAEINRPGNFEIEMDGNLALTESADMMFSELARPQLFRSKSEIQNLTDCLKKYITALIEDGKSFNIFNREGTVLQGVVGMIDKLLNEQYSLNSEIINRYLEDPTRLREFLKEIEIILNKRKDNLKSRARRFHDAVVSETGGYELSGCKVKEDLIVEAMNNGRYLRDLSDTVVSADNMDVLFSKTYKSRPVIAVSDNVKELLREFRDGFLEDKIIYGTLAEIKSKIYHFGLLGPLLKTLKARCINQNSILIRDTNEFINKIIGDSLSPFIYDKIGSTLNHYLIDEFQDTSKMQWLNFRPLVIDTLSKGDDNLIIGDEKQCIYRFRNSKPELLGTEVDADVRQTLGNPDITDIRGLVLSENTNHRSADIIVKFNNSIFASLAEDDKLKSLAAYKNVIQALPKDYEKERGHVKLKFLEAAQSDNSAQMEQKALDAMVEETAQLLKFYNPGDIAVLVRTNSQATEVMERLLSAMEPAEDGVRMLPHFNIVSGQSLTVGSAKSVKMIIDILRIVDSPATLLGEGADESLFKDKKRNNLKSDLARLLHHYHVALSNGKSPETALVEACSPGRGTKESILDVIMNRQSYELIGTIERVIAHLPEIDRKKDAIFISTFQDCVITYMERGGGDIHTFLEWWDKTGSATVVDSPSGTDSLTITTIHKSKGLEFKCVIIPFVCWDFIEDSNAFRKDIRWYDTSALLNLGFSRENLPELLPLEKKKALASTLFASEYEKQNQEQRYDNLNLTYVAFTRAQESLTLISYIKPKSAEPVGEYLLNAVSRSAETIEKQKESDKAVDEKNAKAALLFDLTKYYDSLTSTLEIGSLRHYEPKEETAGKKEKDKKENSLVGKPAVMPPFKSVERREYLRLGKLESNEEYDPEKTRLKGKYGLSKLGTKEEFEEENMKVIGTFLHEVLSKTYTVRDLRYALDSQAEKIMLPPELKEKYFNLINEAINEPDARKWFENTKRVMVERPIAGFKDKTLTFSKPDRVVWTEDGEVHVIDYKFGRPREEKYSEQVEGYITLLRENGVDNVSGYIWYINAKKVVKIN